MWPADIGWSVSRSGRVCIALVDLATFAAIGLDADIVVASKKKTLAEVFIRHRTQETDTR
jgi:4'-phosphopantetheinyl transferase EntD